MTAAASIQTDLKVTPLTDLPNAELTIDSSLKSLRQKTTLIGAR